MSAYFEPLCHSLLQIISRHHTLYRSSKTLWQSAAYPQAKEMMTQHAQWLRDGASDIIDHVDFQ